MTRSLLILFVALATACGGSSSDGAGGTGGAGGGQGGAGGGEPECVGDEECDDGNECTADVCTTEGACENTVVDDNTECTLGVCVFGTCEPVDRAVPCTEEALRQAVTDGGGPIGFLCDGPKTIVTGDEIVIDNDVILDGLGNLTIDADGQHRPFSVLQEVTAEFRRFAITGGAASEGSGGGLLNAGSLTLVDVSVTESTAPSSGGGIHNTGTMAMIRCFVSGNTAGQDGGGVSHIAGALSLVDTAISSNNAGGDGGGLLNRGIVTLTGCTISENEAAGDGGGLAVGNSAMLLNTTLSANAAARGGGIYIQSVVSLNHCTVADNQAGSGNAIEILEGGRVLNIANSLIEGQCTIGANSFLISENFNLESPGNTCNLVGPDDQIDVSQGRLDLGLLQDNGGPTETHALGSESEAVDVIDPVMCEADTDQRGVPRPQGARCDVGAFELEP